MDTNPPTKVPACPISQNGADNKRVAKLNGSATRWWLRSPYCNSSGGSTLALLVSNGGDWLSNYCSNSYGIRPTLILPYDFKFTSDQIAA